MSNNTHIIQDNLALLKTLNGELDELDGFLDSMTQLNHEKDLKRISPKERIDVDWSTAYTLTSLYFVLLKSQNVDFKSHPVKKEMNRLQEFYSNFQSFENKKCLSKIDKDAVGRMIKHSLNETKDERESSANRENEDREISKKNELLKKKKERTYNEINSDDEGALPLEKASNSYSKGNTISTSKVSKSKKKHI